MTYSKFEMAVKKSGMLSGGETIVVAVSGGADSIALLNLLHRFTGNYGGKLVVVHLNHGLRGDEAERDEDFVRTVAEKYDLSFRSKKIDLKSIARTSKLNIQDAGRRERYRFFTEVVIEFNGDKIAVGHHADDQAETVMMRLVRGAGIKGMGGIPPMRDNIIRPLISFDREEIESFLHHEHLEYLDDSSNRNTKYLRNNLRHKVIPLIKELNPKFCREINRFSSIARDMEAYISVKANSALKDITIGCGKELNDTLLLDRQKLSILPPPIKAKVISFALQEVTGKETGFYSVHIENVISLIDKGESGRSLNLPKGVRVIIEYEYVRFEIAGKSKENLLFSYSVNLSGITHIPEAGISLQAEKVDQCKDEESALYLDMEKIGQTLFVRNFMPGDRVKLKGMEGRKKLKNFFIDEKIPREKRASIPLLVSGEEICWIVGLRVCGSLLAKRQSSNIIKISML